MDKDVSLSCSHLFYSLYFVLDVVASDTETAAVQSLAAASIKDTIDVTVALEQQRFVFISSSLHVPVHLL